MRKMLKRSPLTHSMVATLATVLLLALVGCSSTQTTGEEIDDALITTKVKSMLAADPAVNPFEIDVDTMNQVVYLNGIVDTWDERMEAERLAREVGGVVGVVNELKYGDVEPSAEEVFDDARIVAKVEAKLAADLDINSFDLDVDSNMGVVTLRGSVETMDQKREAEAIARNTSGVKRIDNDISVRGN